MIIAMKRLSLIALKSDQDRILKALQECGTVQVLNIADSEVQDPSADAVNARIQRLTESIGAVKPYAKKPGFLSPQKRDMTLDALRRDVPKAENAAGEIEELLHRQTHLAAEREKALNTKESLEPWVRLGVPMDSVKNTPRVHYFIGLCASKDQPKIEEQSYLEAEYYNEAAMVPTILACKEEDTRIVQNFLKTIDWQDYVFPKLEGTPGQAIQTLDQRIAEIDRETEQIQTAG